MPKGSNTALALLATGWLLVAAGPVHAAGTPPPSTLPASHRAVLETYCFGCHNQKLRTAGLTLDTLSPDDVSADAAVWEKVIRKLRLETMPPSGRPRPDQATYRALASKTGLSAGYLNHVVHGNRPVPSNDIVERLAAALGVEPEHFLEYRVRTITERLERMPELVDRLYRRLGTSARP